MADEFTIPSEFTKEDLKTMLDALDDYEKRDTEMLSMIEKLKLLDEPEEGSVPDEYRRTVMSFRQHMLSQEERAMRDRDFRRERATLLKAKIILMNQRKAAEKALEDSIPPFVPRSKRDDS